MKGVFYNDHEPYVAQWLRNLIEAGLIERGTVDERSITELRPSDIAGYTRCHFFSGIGGWDYALRLAGWPTTQPVWTASLPCQPFSAAGKQEGGADDRHLWPVFFDLVKEHRPATIFGEQVEAAIAHGWLDRVFADLEAEGYTCGAVAVPACGVGAPHIRQRIYWVADAERDWRHDRRREFQRGDETCPGPETQERSEYMREAARYGDVGGLGDSTGSRRQGPDRASESEQGFGSGRQHRPWSEYDLIPCADGKARRIEPGTFPLAHGVSGRVGKLRAYGNAIVPPLAAEFVKAFMAGER